MDDRRDERVQGSNGHRAQVRAVRPAEFTRAKRQAFVNTLAATCNVTTAARAAGINSSTANRLRRRSPEFAALWAEALEIGYAHLEEQLLARAMEALDAMAIDPDAARVAPLPPLPAPGEELDGAAANAPSPGGPGALSGRGLPAAYQLALVLLGQRRAAMAHGPRSKRRKVPTTGEVDAMLATKLDRLDRLEAERVRRATPAGPEDPSGGDAA